MKRITREQNKKQKGLWCPRPKVRSIVSERRCWLNPNQKQNNLNQSRYKMRQDSWAISTRRWLTWRSWPRVIKKMTNRKVSHKLYKSQQWYLLSASRRSIQFTKALNRPYLRSSISRKRHQLHPQLSKRWRLRCTPSSTRLHHSSQIQQRPFKASTNFRLRKFQKQLKNKCSQKTLLLHSWVRLMSKRKKRKTRKKSRSTKTIWDRDSLRRKWCMVKVRIHIQPTCQQVCQRVFHNRILIVAHLPLKVAVHHRMKAVLQKREAPQPQKLRRLQLLKRKCQRIIQSRHIWHWNIQKQWRLLKMQASMKWQWAIDLPAIDFSIPSEWYVFLNQCSETNDLAKIYDLQPSSISLYSQANT